VDDHVENIHDNPQSWIAWKNEAERLQEIIDKQHSWMHEEFQGKGFWQYMKWNWKLMRRWWGS
jgi:hypothetical protein